MFLWKCDFCYPLTGSLSSWLRFVGLLRLAITVANASWLSSSDVQSAGLVNRHGGGVSCFKWNRWFPWILLESTVTANRWCRHCSSCSVVRIQGAKSYRKCRMIALRGNNALSRRPESWQGILTLPETLRVIQKFHLFVIILGTAMG